MSEKLLLSYLMATLSGWEKKLLKTLILIRIYFHENHIQNMMDIHNIMLSEKQIPS